ncbi:UNVERIFIED_CONTAM: hypothetical protein HDU68_011918 [Siphonaria sp. JEL0065]|nr:hypothetical protein HDU68_011918 [Siphonaria sp. JEL0065]
MPTISQQQVPILSHIPLDIAIHLQSYISSCSKYPNSGLSSEISKLVETFTQLERIRDTPLPAAYTIQLYHILILYLAVVPLEFVSSIGWLTIPATAITAFTLLGLIEIAEEVENPFGYGIHDLPLDEYCQAIQDKIWYLLEREDSGTSLGWEEPMTLDDYCVAEAFGQGFGV